MLLSWEVTKRVVICHEMGRGSEQAPSAPKMDIEWAPTQRKDSRLFSLDLKAPQILQVLLSDPVAVCLCVPCLVQRVIRSHIQEGVPVAPSVVLEVRTQRRRERRGGISTSKRRGARSGAFWGEEQ